MNTIAAYILCGLVSALDYRTEVFSENWPLTVGCYRTALCNVTCVYGLLSAVMLRGHTQYNLSAAVCQPRFSECPYACVTSLHGWLMPESYATMCTNRYQNCALESLVVLLANVNSRSRSLYVVVRPSVCRLSVCRLSVTFVHPT